MKNRYIIFVFGIIILSGCAMPNHKDPVKLGEVDVEREVFSDKAKEMISSSYDRGEEVKFSVNYNKKIKVRERKKNKYKKCTEVQYRAAVEDGPLFVVIDIALLPLYILHNITSDIDTGCREYEEWERWRVVDNNGAVDNVPYIGAVSFKSSNNSVVELDKSNIDLSESDSGKGKVGLNFRYPYEGYSNVKDMALSKYYLI